MPISKGMRDAAKRPGQISTSVSPKPVPSPRKTSSPSSVSLFPKVSAGSNIDSIVEAASGLRAVSIITNQIASLARSEITEARAAITSLLPARQLTPSTRPQVDENDVSTEQSRQVSIVRSNLPKFNSIPLSANVNETANNLIRSSRKMFMPLPQHEPIKIENKMTPDLDSVSLQLKKGKGISDSFFARVTVSVPVKYIDDNLVASIRVFRSTIISPTLSRPLTSLSARGVDTIMSRPMISRSKNENQISNLSRRLADDGIENDIETYNPKDRFTQNRITAKPISSRHPIDSSVSQNPTFIDAARLQDPNFGLYEYDENSTAGKNDQGNSDLGQAHVDDLSTRESRFGMVVNNSNSAGFQQIFVSKPNGLQSKKIGNRYYFTFNDEGIVFGRQYQYYVTTVDKNMIQSNRSAIASINVDGLRVPPRPKEVLASSDGSTITLFSTCEDQFVEKYEIWKKDSEVSKAKNEFVVYRSDNGYSLVDEITNPEHKGGANWVDRIVIPGHTYTYRVYSVDIFGNKSESPFETSVVVPDTFNGDDKSLTRPSLIAEVDSKTHKMKITMSCQDTKVKRLRLERRDLTIGQDSFVVPYQSDRIIMGPQSFKHGSRVHGERIQDEDNISIWNGYFDNTTGSIIFVDKLTSFDRTYQYRVVGTDDRGSRTSYAYSAPVLVMRKPMINVPVNVSSTLVTGTGGNIVGVTVSWNSSSLDVSTEDKLGSQAALADTSVRTLYQVERQKSGERWLLFNMTSDQKVFDPVVGYSGTIAPEFRPPFLDLNTQYNYRVQAVMSGGYISNATQQISVFVGYGVSDPIDFMLRTPDPRSRPFYVMLNWGTKATSGVVDHWEIERYEMNNFAAARINVRNVSSMSKLAFKLHRKVFRESSRFHVFWSDYKDSQARSSVIVGQHHFMDSEVLMGNTYFYRIRAVDSRGNKSNFVYRAMRLSYSSFERMVEEITSADERRILTSNPVPLRTSANIESEQPTDSMSLNPTFSTPGRLKQPVATFMRKLRRIG